MSYLFVSNTAQIGGLIPVEEGIRPTLMEIETSTTEPLVFKTSDTRTHLSIIVREGVEAVVQIQSVSTYLAVEVFVEAGGNLKCHCIANNPVAVQLVERSRIEKDAKIHWFNFTANTPEASCDLKNEVVGFHAHSSVDWVFHSVEKEKQQITVSNSFQAKQGSGVITLRGVAENSSSVDCKGLIAIAPNAGGTDAFLHQDVLMLDETARVKTVPGLEIKTNDVKASHSASIRRITDADLFYFASRGIDRPEARGMYIQGFLGQPPLAS